MTATVPAGPGRPRWWQAGRRRLSRLPLRVRLVAGFAAAITVVLTAAGAFVYWRVSYALDLRLDDDLRAEAGALAPLVMADGHLAADAGLDRTAGARQYQVLTAGGVLLASGSELGPVALLSPRQAGRASRHELVADVGALLPRSPRPLRLLAVPLPPVPGPVPATAARVLLVADRRDERDEALRELLAQLLVAGTAALGVSTLVGERLAKAALSPVERYRSRAASIAGGARGLRLEVPVGRDDEVTRLGHTLNDVLDALEHAVDAERRFTQDASHELRTPLTVLSTRIQLALRRPRTAAEHEATLAELGHDVDALAALAADLLQISTSDASRHAEVPDGSAAVPAPYGCDLAAVTGEVVRGPLPDSPAHVVVSVDPGAATMPVAMSDRQVRQVLGNLLGNALGHGGGDVQVRVRRAPGAAVVSVTDGGPGVDPAFLPAAADRFARADTARGRPGAGLGLALVNGLVGLHGGELRLCSRGCHHRYADALPAPCSHPPDGTTATVLLPLLPRPG